MPRQPGRPYLGDERFDQLARMMFQLLSEVWVMRDRMVVMEELLQRKKVMSAARLDALRQQMVEAVLGAPQRNDETIASLVEKGRAARDRAKTP
jgi:hypothetical protein